MNQSITVLLAEDEVSLAQIVKESLESRGFQVHLALDGEEALAIYHDKQPDILVLDVMIPKIDGFSLAQSIRNENSSVPILFLTAKSQVQDVVTGFESGGNDYLKKPFSMEELIVRIKALLNRLHQSPPAEAIPLGTYTFNYQKQCLVFNNKTTNLTHREAALLYHLIQKRNTVLDRSFILNKLWGNDDFFSGRSMDVFITKLRKKLKDDPAISIINVRGIGYKLIW